MISTTMASKCGDEPGDGECSICNELLTTPKLLPCGHHLCRHCLISWIQSKTDAPCPLCRCPIVQSGDKGAGVEAGSVADGLPTDLFKEKLVEAERLLSKDHKCRACEDVAATAFCLQCGDMLCPSCKNVHKKLSMSKDHAVEDLASLTAQRLAASRQSVCAVHPEETCRLYCPSHATSLCWLCASTKHRVCSDLVELDDKAEEADQSLDDLLEKLVAGEDDIDRVINLLDQHWKKTEEYVHTAVVEIEETRRFLESSVQIWEQRLKEQTMKEHDYIKAAVQEAKEYLLRRRGKLSTHKGVVRQGRGMKNREVVDKMLMAMRTRVAELDHTSALPDDAKVISTLKLTLDKEAVSRFELELSSLGQVSVSPADSIGNVKPTTLQFHDNHGRHTRVSNFQQTATKVGQQYGGGIVMSCDPLKQHFLYEVQIVYQFVTVSKKRHKLETVAVGAVTEAPDTIDPPDTSADLHSAFVRNRTWLKTPDQVEVTYLCGPQAEALGSLRCGDRVGVSLDSVNDLHLYLNGQDRGLIAPEVPQPCYALFELCGKAGQITALPVTKVMDDQLNKSLSSASAEAK